MMSKFIIQTQTLIPILFIFNGNEDEKEKKIDD